MFPTELVVQEVYIWESIDGSTKLSFDISAIKKWLEGNIPAAKDYGFIVPIDSDYAVYMEKNNGLEPEHFKRLKANPARLDTPILGAMMDDGTVILIDGAHRYYVNYTLGNTNIKMYLFPREVWERYLVPEEVSAMTRKHHINGGF